MKGVLWDYFGHPKQDKKEKLGAWSLLCSFLLMILVGPIDGHYVIGEAIIYLSIMLSLSYVLCYYSFFSVGTSDTYLFCPTTEKMILNHGKKIVGFCILFPTMIMGFGSLAMFFWSGVDIPKLIFPVLNIALLSYFACGSSFYIRNKTNEQYSFSMSDVLSGNGMGVSGVTLFTYMLILMAETHGSYYPGLYVIEWTVFVIIDLPIALRYVKYFQRNFEAACNYEGMKKV
jgi:hypothetical protein